MDSHGTLGTASTFFRIVLPNSRFQAQNAPSKRVELQLARAFHCIDRTVVRRT